MEETLKELENCQREFEATLDYEELKPHFEKAIVEHKKKVTIPGFRKGKAPISMVKKMYGDSIEYTAVEDVASKVFLNYISDNKIELADKGSLVDIDYQPKEKLNFKVQFEIRPEVEIKKLDGLTIKKIKYEVDESLVDDEVKYHLLQNASHEMDGQALDNEYIVTVDINNLDKAGNLIIGESTKDVKIYLNNKELLPEFRQALEGVKENEDRVVETKDKDGNPQKLKLTVTKVEKIVFPEMTEEFFKKVTTRDDIKTEEDFRKAIKEDLEKYYERESKSKLDSEVIKIVVESNPVKVPDTYIDRISDEMVKDYEKNSKQQLNDSQRHEAKQQFRPMAFNQASWYMLRGKIIESEKIELTDEDFKKIVEENSNRLNIPADKLMEVYKSNHGVSENLLTGKVLEFVISKANITEEVKQINSNTISQTENQ